MLIFIDNIDEKNIEEWGYRNIHDRTITDIFWNEYMAGIVDAFDIIYFGF